MCGLCKCVACVCMMCMSVCLCLSSLVLVCPPQKGDPIARGTAIGWPASTSRARTRSHCQVQFLCRTEVCCRWLGWTEPVLYLSLASGRRAARA